MPTASASDARSSHAFGVGLILVTLLSWASIPLFLRSLWTDYHLDPFTANGYRYALSAAFWLPFLIFARRRGNLPTALLTAAIVPTIFNLLGQTAFAWGPALLEPGFFSFVFRVQIVFVTLGAYILFPAERVALRRPAYWLGIALVIVGSVGLIAMKDPAPLAGPSLVITTNEPALASARSFIKPGSAEHPGLIALGVGVSLLSGVMFAGYALSVRQFVSHYSPVTSFGVICQYTALGAIVIMFGAPLLNPILPGTLAHADPMLPLRTFGFDAWTLIIASSFIGIAISHVSYYASIKRLGVSVSSGIIQLQPIITALASLVLFDERLNAWQWLSGSIGIAGALLMLSVSWRAATAGSEAQTLTQKPTGGANGSD